MRRRVHSPSAATSTMVVSVSRNTADGGDVQADPSLYRPEFLRIDLTVSAGETTVLGKAQVRVRRDG